MSIRVPHEKWVYGHISAEDTHCFVTCECGEHFSVSDVITYCDKCGYGYVNEFTCYRIIKDKTDEPDA